MNYTKTIREFCLQNKGEIFDVSFMKDAYFEMIPYKTLLKILNRLEEENIVTCVSKGVYHICDDDIDSDDAIIDRYISDGRGMCAGYTMYNELGITDHKNEFLEYYTNRLSTRFKTIGKYQFTKVDLPFTPEVISMVKLLDCIEKGHSVIDRNIIKYREAIDTLSEKYSDKIFSVVFSGVRYHYSTVITLKEQLDKKGIENDCLAIFKRYDSK